MLDAQSHFKVMFSSLVVEPSSRLTHSFYSAAGKKAMPSPPSPAAGPTRTLRSTQPEPVPVISTPIDNAHTLHSGTTVQTSAPAQPKARRHPGTGKLTPVVELPSAQKASAPAAPACTKPTPKPVPGDALNPAQSDGSTPKVGRLKKTKKVATKSKPGSSAEVGNVD